MDAALDIYSDTKGTVYIAGELRHQIFWMCEVLGRERREIHYNMDLKCYVLELRKDADKEVLKKLLPQNKWQRKSDNRHGKRRIRR